MTYSVHFTIWDCGKFCDRMKILTMMIIKFVFNLRWFFTIYYKLQSPKNIHSFEKNSTRLHLIATFSVFFSLFIVVVKIDKENNSGSFDFDS